MTEVGVKRAAERVELACKALSGAANDLRVAHRQLPTTAIDEAADMIGAETERVCEMAEELADLAGSLKRLPVFASAALPAE
jgi:hypothetical protein